MRRPISQFTIQKKPKIISSKNLLIASAITFGAAVLATPMPREGYQPAAATAMALQRQAVTSSDIIVPTAAKIQPTTMRDKLSAPIIARATIVKPTQSADLVTIKSTSVTERSVPPTVQEEAADTVAQIAEAPVLPAPEPQLPSSPATSATPAAAPTYVASVDGSGYPYANAPFPNSTPDPWGMYMRQCVSYTAWKVAASGRHMPYWGGRGNATQWDDNARAAGIAVNGTPRVGSVAIDNSINHAAYVESVNGDGTVTVSHYNYGTRGGYSVDRLSVSGLVFIHF